MHQTTPIYMTYGYHNYQTFYGGHFKVQATNQMIIQECKFEWDRPFYQLHFYGGQAHRVCVALNTAVVGVSGRVGMWETPHGTDWRWLNQVAERKCFSASEKFVCTEAFDRATGISHSGLNRQDELISDEPLLQRVRRIAPSSSTAASLAWKMLVAWKHINLTIYEVVQSSYTWSKRHFYINTVKIKKLLECQWAVN